MSQPWTRQPERSTSFWLNTIVWIALRIGRPVALALLYPITTYFLVFSVATRHAARAYLRRVLGRRPTWHELFRHYHTFAQTLLDRVFVFAGQVRLFRLELDGFELLEDCLRERRGCLLVGAHLGSFEILRAVGRLQRGLPIKALVYGENSPKINALFQKINPGMGADIIPMGAPMSLIGVEEHLQQGGIIALLGDRSVYGEKRVRCRFFDEEAWFPAAPVLLANLLKVPVILFYCLHRGNARYAIRFEPLAREIHLDRRDRQSGVRHWMQRYAESLERQCRQAPYNWFNFYDFWDRR